MPPTQIRVASAYGPLTTLSSWNDFCGGRSLLAQVLGLPAMFFAILFALSGPVAQLVEQRIENPRVSGSIPLQATSLHYL